MSASDVRLHAIVHGRVQGVGFRYFVIEEAERLGVCGWVRNLPDGSVEAQAEGPRPALEMLHAALQRGPRGAYVTRVGVDWGAATGEYEGFHIRRP